MTSFVIIMLNLKRILGASQGVA
ncbi:hypothetical protein VAS14_14919 [Photobacterium angustum S14]|uniref:Uncharacterized protein n=1 Tax=Photobacterium angustum (strain S14 / CCUG 15956) TaxID=314292 RepID=Q1ZTZ1_PHOAS|nr:hypothetical protein VAS14_14919 [Photobacterium angustum S14]